MIYFSIQPGVDYRMPCSGAVASFAALVVALGGFVNAKIACTTASRKLRWRSTSSGGQS
jgi:hypothetical protein